MRTMAATSTVPMKQYLPVFFKYAGMLVVNTGISVQIWFKYPIL